MNPKRVVMVPAILVLMAIFAACGGGAPQTYTVGGSISGLGAGKGIALLEAVSGQTLSLTENGSFTFPTALADGAEYRVEIATNPAAQGCIIENGAGQVGGADVTDVSLTCGDSGTLDASFADQGKLVEPMMVPIFEVSALTLQADGKIVAAGSYYDSGDHSSNYVFLRTDADGNYDGGFGSGGKVTINYDSDYVVDVQVLEGGDVLFAGGGLGDFILGRLGSDGQQEYLKNTNFDSSAYERPVALFVGDDGITVVGWIREQVGSTTVERVGFARYKDNGDLDPAFGSGGLLVKPYADSSVGVRVVDVVRLPDGKFVVLGETRPSSASDYDIALARFDADGSLDTSFGSSGWVTLDIEGDDQYADALALQPDGKLVMVGRSYDGSEYQIVLSRLLPDGSLDSEFADAGMLLEDLGGDYERFDDVAVQTDGKILAAGLIRDSSGEEKLALVRYLADGSRDADFGDDGVATFVLESGYDSYASTILIQPDGRILVGGSAKGEALGIIRVWQ